MGRVDGRAPAAPPGARRRDPLAAVGPRPGAAGPAARPARAQSSRRRSPARPSLDVDRRPRLRPRWRPWSEMLARVATYTNAPDLVDARAAADNMQARAHRRRPVPRRRVPEPRRRAARHVPRGGASTSCPATRRSHHVEAIADDRVVVDLGNRWIIGSHGRARRRRPRPATGSSAPPGGVDRPRPAPDRRLPRARPPPPARATASCSASTSPLYLSTHCPPADLAPPGHAVVHVMRYQPVDDTMPADDQRAAAPRRRHQRRHRRRRHRRGAVPRPHGRDRPPADGRRRRPGRATAGRRWPTTRACSWPATGSARPACSATPPWPAARKPVASPPTARPGWRWHESAADLPTLPPVDDPEFTPSERPRLLGVAYRITGSRADAEDVVQDAWLRWQRTERATIERPEAWLTTVTSRIALDRLKSAQRTREDVRRARGSPRWPTPIPGPADHAEMAESLTVGFLDRARAARPGGAGRVPARRRVRLPVRRDRRRRRQVPRGLPADRLASPPAGAGGSPELRADRRGRRGRWPPPSSSPPRPATSTGCSSCSPRAPCRQRRRRRPPRRPPPDRPAERIPRFISNIVQRREARLGPDVELSPSRSTASRAS